MLYLRQTELLLYHHVCLKVQECSKVAMSAYVVRRGKYSLLPLGRNNCCIECLCSEPYSQDLSTMCSDDPM